MKLVNQEHRATGPRTVLFRNPWRWTAALVLAILASLLVGSPPAQAGPWGLGEVKWNAHTDRCLSDSFAGGLQVLPCDESRPYTQLWQDIWAVGDNQPFWFRNRHTNRCLQDSFAGGLQALPCHDVTQNTQLWDHRQTLSGRILSNRHTGRCLSDSFAGGLQVLPCDGSSPNTQRWLSGW
ncbi:hypothetical protein GCM10022251_75280 [Phytohabitans flavus]|uniref:Uncharacterized protein n=1 Tax=Phytohabitans flavus TaxID=1076124 RepID=A0A6F8XME5_9ACTN|nr:hypothetical protein Pflav_013690 [Phytohabitans flavus]